MAKLGKARQGKAGQGCSRQGNAGQGRAMQDKSGQGKAGQSNSILVMGIADHLLPLYCYCLISFPMILMTRMKMHKAMRRLMKRQAGNHGHLISVRASLDVNTQ